MTQPYSLDQQYSTKHQQTFSFLHFLVGVAIFSFHIHQFSLLVSSYKPFFTLFCIKHNMCTPHSGQDMHTSNAYGSLSMLRRTMPHRLRLTPNNDDHLSSTILCTMKQTHTLTLRQQVRGNAYYAGKSQGL